MQAQFHFQITGEPKWENVPLISSIIVAALLVAIWSAFAYRRGGYVRRPRLRLF